MVCTLCYAVRAAAVASLVSSHCSRSSAWVAHGKGSSVAAAVSCAISAGRHLVVVLVAAAATVLRCMPHVAKATDEAGASQRQPRAPIAAAATADAVNGGVRVEHVNGMKIEFLVEQGAAAARPASKVTGTTNSSKAACTRVSCDTALQLAAKWGQVDTVRLLLQRSLADPNAPDEIGCTPLMAACSCLQVRVEVVRLLLEAGADPTLAAKDGFTPMHAVAQLGHTDLIDLLHSSSPTAVNIRTPDGETPLFMACYYGQEEVVSRLLSLGAVRPEERKMCPLTMAVRKGFVGVVRTLVNQGMEAIGGKTVLPKALYASARFGQGRILRVLLRADREEMRSEWANISVMGKHLLHYGAGYCCPAAVSALLETGVDESARDLEGRLPRDALGVELGQGVSMDQGKEVAIRRMLQRGPAYRARSWAWPSEEADAGCHGDRNPSGGGGVGATGAAGAALSAPPAPKTPVASVRIFRPTNDKKLFMRIVDR